MTENKHTEAVKIDRNYMTALDVRSAIFHLGITTMDVENTGNTHEHPHIKND